MLIAFNTLALAIGFALDALIGDPQGWPHIVRGFGGVIAAFEKLLYPIKNKKFAGVLFVAATLIVCTGVPGALLYAAWRVSPWVYTALEAILVWQLIAVKSLKKESRKVYDRLEKNDLDGARKAVSMIVGRDTQQLTPEGVTKAAVETVAENTADGVAAPMMCIALGGALFGCFYKAVNTMDSSVGYKNDRYMDFGTAAAKLDDVMNFLPSRICALIMIAAAAICGMNGKNAWRIWKRDRRKHASPNSAQTESVMAGAMEIRLAGDAYYFGKLHKKPYIGDDIRPVCPRDILGSHRLLNATSLILILITFILRGVVYAAI